MKPAQPATSPRRNDWIACLLILLFTVIYYAPVIFEGKALLPTQVVLYTEPWKAHIGAQLSGRDLRQTPLLGPMLEYYCWRAVERKMVRQGVAPLWNPYEFGGNVLLANNQSAPYYPLNLLIYLLPLWVALNWIAILQTLITGLAAYGLLRLHRLHPISALTGALAWMFCALQIVWLEFQTPTAALCWLPVALLGWEYGRQRNRWQWQVMGAGAALGLSLLAGHLQFSFYVGMALVLYALIVSTGMGKREYGRQVILLAGAIIFSIALASVELLPTFEMGRINFRAVPRSYPESIALRLPPINLLTLLLPNFLGSQALLQQNQYYWGAFNFIEYATYLGIPCLLFALIGCWWDKKTATETPSGVRGWLAFVVLAIVGLLLALGTPLCAILFYLMPGYRQFNATARALCLFSFGMAALAGYGVQQLINQLPAEGKSLKSFYLRVGWTAFGVGLAALFTFPGLGLKIQHLFTNLRWTFEWDQLARCLIALVITLLAIRAARRWQVVCWFFPVLAAADLLVWSAGFNPMTDPANLFPPTQLTRQLPAMAGNARILSLKPSPLQPLEYLVPNFNAVLGLREVQGSDSVHSIRYHRLMVRIEERMSGRPAHFSDDIHLTSADDPLLNMLGVKYVVTRRILNSNNLRLVAPLSMNIYRNMTAYPSVWIVHSALSASDGNVALNTMMAANFNPRLEAVVEGRGFPVLQPVSSRSSERAALVSFTPTRVVYKAHCKAKGLLVCSEMALPGWKVTVDGRPAHLWLTDYVLRGVVLSRGAHRVVFRYQPSSYRFGLYLSLIAIGVLLGWIGYGWSGRIYRARNAAATLKIG